MSSASSTSGPPAKPKGDPGEARRRLLRVWQTAQLRDTGEQVEFMQFGRRGLRPLIWLHSVDYSMPPSWGFCVDAAEAGYGLVAIRRPGFGKTSRVDSDADEARLLEAFMAEAGYDDAVLVMHGSSRPAGLRLALNSGRIAYSFLVRPTYNGNGIGVTPETWWSLLVGQAIRTGPGAELALAALRSIGPDRMFKSIFGAPADLAYVEANRKDVAEAWVCTLKLDAQTFRRNVASFGTDPLLGPGSLASFPGRTLIGADTPAGWKANCIARSEEYGIPVSFLPAGFAFALQQCQAEFLALLSAVPPGKHPLPARPPREG